MRETMSTMKNVQGSSITLKQPTAGSVHSRLTCSNFVFLLFSNDNYMTIHVIFLMVPLFQPRAITSLSCGGNVMLDRGVSRNKIL